MTRKLSAIVAVCDDWGIGCEGDMVVSNRADMRHFVACTKGCPVIMGRKTLLSFPGGRPLKNRRNIVLTREEDFAPEGVDVVHSVDEALAAVADETSGRNRELQSCVSAADRAHALQLAFTAGQLLDNSTGKVIRYVDVSDLHRL